MTTILEVADSELYMIVTVSKWGNSLGLRIPRSLAEDAHLDDGTSVDLRIEDGRLVVELVEERSLDQLLRQVTPQNLHGDAFPSSSIGTEMRALR